MPFKLRHDPCINNASTGNLGPECGKTCTPTRSALRDRPRPRRHTISIEIDHYMVERAANTLGAVLLST
jgi:hypothetical protein